MFFHRFALSPVRLLATSAMALLAFAAPVQADTRIEEDTTLSGSYLAGRSADLAYDMPTAIEYYEQVHQFDPGNQGLVERTLLLALASGQMDKADGLAAELLKLNPSNPAAGIAVAVNAIKAKEFPKALAALDALEPGELATMAAGLIKAWIQFEQGDTAAALATVSGLKGPAWYNIFATFHTALLLDAAGRSGEAVAAIKTLYKPTSREQEIVLGYVRIMARSGDRAEAQRALTAYGGDDPTNSALREMQQLINGPNIPPVASDAATGASEALFGLGAAIGLGDEPALSLAYFRMAGFLDPQHYANTMAIGATLQAIGRCQDASAIFAAVPPDTAWWSRAQIEIGTCQLATDHGDQAILDFKSVADRDPNDIEAVTALGDAYRDKENWQGAVDSYARALALKQGKGQKDWRLHYFRGIGYERLGQYDKAEADFNAALSIDDQQPQVLNYLGYMWVDRGIRLDDGLKLIKKAVSLSPDAGYIVDSLGWAEYRLGQYPDAVDTLERAVALSSSDPTMNDHLGDAYWQVGRMREAHYQWSHARDFKPDPELAAAIDQKLEHGLAGVRPGTITVGPGESLWDIATRALGDGHQYLRIYEANRDRISDPNVIEPGWELTLPNSK